MKTDANAAAVNDIDDSFIVAWHCIESSECIGLCYN